jgi:hypothetical protein
MNILALGGYMDVDIMALLVSQIRAATVFQDTSLSQFKLENTLRLTYVACLSRIHIINTKYNSFTHQFRTYYFKYL